jgi:hypothetical protein
MSASRKRPGSSRVPAHLEKVAYEYGSRMAEVIVTWLNSNGRPFHQSNQKAPLPYLLELGAILQLALWESAGFAEQLPSDLPTLSQAREELKTRAALGPQEFVDPKKARLFECVFLVWWEHFAWHAPELLDAEVLLGQLNEDEVVQQLARFFWETRHSTSIINKG